MLVDSANHRYRQLKYNHDGTTIFWSCLKERRNNCKARIHTDRDFTIVKVSGKHIHAPDVGSGEEKVEYVNLCRDIVVPKRSEKERLILPKNVKKVKTTEKENPLEMALRIAKVSGNSNSPEKGSGEETKKQIIEIDDSSPEKGEKDSDPLTE